MTEHTENPPHVQHVADGSIPWSTPGTGLWFAAAVADALLAEGFQFSTRARKWDRFQWVEFPNVGRWVRASMDEVLRVAADVAADLWSSLSDRLAAIQAELDSLAVEHHNRLIGEYRRVCRWRAWLSRQQSARGLLAAVRLARLQGRLRYIGPPLESQRTRPSPRPAQVARGAGPRVGRRTSRPVGSRV